MPVSKVRGDVSSPLASATPSVRQTPQRRASGPRLASHEDNEATTQSSEPTSADAGLIEGHSAFVDIVDDGAGVEDGSAVKAPASEDEIQEEEALVRSLASAPRRVHPVWSFHASQPDDASSEDVDGAAARSQEIPERFDQLSVDAEARALLAFDDDSHGYDSDWTEFANDVATIAKAAQVESVNVQASEPESKSSQQKASPSTEPPPKQSKQKSSQPIPKAPPPVAMPQPPVTARKRRSTRTSITPSTPLSARLASPRKSLPPPPSNPITPAATQPSTPSPRKSSKTAPQTPRAPMESPASPSAPISPKSRALLKSSSSSLAATPGDSSLIASLQSQVAASRNALAAKALRVRALEEEKSSLASENAAMRAQLTALQEERTRSADITPASPPVHTPSLPAQQHRTHLQSKRLRLAEDALVATQAKLSKVQFALDASRRRLRLKVAHGLPPGVLRTLATQRAQIGEMRERLAHEEATGGARALLESQHTIAEQNALIDTLQRDLADALDGNARDQPDTNLSDHDPMRLTTTSAFVDAPPIMEESVDDILDAAFGETTDVARRVDLPTNVDPSATHEAARHTLTHVALDPKAAPLQVKAPLETVQSAPTPAPVSQPIPSTNSAATKVDDASTTASASPTSSSAIPTTSDLPTAALLAARADVDAARRQLAASSDRVASLSRDLRIHRALLSQYESRHALSSRLARNQYAQLCALTREYHARGDIVHALTTKLREAREDQEWAREEARAATDTAAEGEEEQDAMQTATQKHDEDDPWASESKEEEEELLLPSPPSSHVHLPPPRTFSAVGHTVLPPIDERKELSSSPSSSPTSSNTAAHSPSGPSSPSAARVVHLLHQPTSSPAPPPDAAASVPHLPALSHASSMPTISSVLAASLGVSASRSVASSPRVAPSPLLPSPPGPTTPRVTQMMIQSLAAIPAYPAGFTPPGRTPVMRAQSERRR